ncbi:chondroitin-sulfate-ABC endolyase/exolyase [Volucribacter psittacicida]|uniref:Chondroitin sulfate ABC lyase n=1 Tax=Volucribacter psittacicida TaxID=203482 RepID=A0A4R1FQQ9_9PAST|nr:chondroitinase family polysaccharide lyase [Volucribacter psittacicida]TCJ95874.1 chondroitin-sulfate-ABC endolyase/exolyase [Volucribacter psittacicida]
MKKYKLHHIATLLAALSLSTLNYAADYRWDFFEQPLGSTIKVSQGKIETSKQRFKDGQQSLRWQFEPKGQLIINQAIDLRSDDNVLPQTFLLWLYNDKPFPEPLTFEFKQGGQQKKSFVANLDFTGWRGIAVPFRDMQGDKVEQLDQLVITAPNQAGQLYLDQMLFNVPVDNRNPIPDYITPFVNPTVDTAVNKNWNALYMYDQMLAQHFPQLDFHQPLNSNDNSQSIYQKFEHHLGKGKELDAKKLLEIYRTFAISEQQGVINGKMLDFPARQKFMKNDQVFNAEQQAFLLTSISMRELGKTLLDTAKLLRYGDLSDQDRQALQTEFLLATRYLFDQGFVRGSSMQIVTHLGYQTREIFDAWFLMRDLLAQQGLLADAQGAMMWFNGTGRIFEQDNDIVAANVDILNTQLQWMLKSILLLPDSQQKQALLTQFSQWLSKTIMQSKGIAGGFKSDGSVFHHGQHYVAYGRDAFGGLAPTVYALSGSDYALTQPARQRLDDVLHKMWLYTKSGEIPIVLSGRHPTGIFKLSSAPFRWFALAGESDNPQQIQREFAGIFANLDKRSDFEGVPAANEPTGAWTMNYASMVLQRRAAADDPTKSWLAVARGFSRYLVGNEAYERNNRYSRYLQYGTLELLPADMNKRAFNHAGWDWNRYPGTTAIHLPYDKLKSILHQLPAAGVEEMLLSTESYAGGTDLNDNAMYAVRLHGHSKYQQQDFYANKSYFLFNNQIIALGTDIQNQDQHHHTETTLFQHYVPELQAVEINGKKINQLGTQQQFATPAKLVDPAGNAYFLPADQQIRFSYDLQQSLDDRDDKATQGQFSTAVIDHGTAPQQASYEYAILVADSQAEPNYQVLAKQKDLHAVKDLNSQQEGYAYFAPHQGDIGGVVIGADNPLMVLAEPQQNRLALSVVNPDFAFYSGVEKDQVDEQGNQVEVSVYSRAWWTADPQPQHSTLTLKGKWQLAEPSQCAKVSVKQQQSLLTTTTNEARPCKVVLKSL